MRYGFGMLIGMLAFGSGPLFAQSLLPPVETQGSVTERAKVTLPAPPPLEAADAPGNPGNPPLPTPPPVAPPPPLAPSPVVPPAPAMAGLPAPPLVVPPVPTKLAIPAPVALPPAKTAKTAKLGRPLVADPPAVPASSSAEGTIALPDPMPTKTVDARLEFRDPLAVPPAPAAVQLQDPTKVTTNLQLPDLCVKCPTCDTYHVWARAEYLLWWVKDAPVPVPLVTTGDPAVGFPFGATAGAIGQPGTRVLFGNSNVDFGAFSGMRLVLGGWLGAERIFGIEGAAFLLENRTSHYSASSDGAGNPALYFPAFNVVAGQERALPIADPLRGYAGNVFITSSLQLWGAEVNGLLNVWRRPGAEFSFLVGARYMDLRENLDLHNTTTDLIFANVQTTDDQFHTRNQFYGGQLGARASLERSRFSLDLTGKLALGVTHQVVDVGGNSSEVALPGGFAPTPGSFAGGLYAQPTNIGRRTANEFTVLPSFEVKVAYHLTPRTLIFAGYDVLYWNQVVRPGNQIDRNINPSQSPLFGGAGGGALVGPANPAPLFQRSDFWAQGVNFGLEFRY